MRRFLLFLIFIGILTIFIIITTTRSFGYVSTQKMQKQILPLFSCNKRFPTPANLSIPAFQHAFISDNFTTVYFMGFDHARCVHPKEREEIQETLFFGRKFLCMFEDDLVWSKPIYEGFNPNPGHQRPRHAHLLVVQCNLPRHLRSKAQMIDTKTSIIANFLIPLDAVSVPSHLEETKPIFWKRENDIIFFKLGEHILAGYEGIPLCHFIADEGAAQIPPKSYLSACTRLEDGPFKETHRRLPEWIEYHRLIGVEHFYIFDNSDDGYEGVRNLLDLYIERNIVTYIPWPLNDCRPHGPKHFWNSQYIAENTCLNLFRDYSSFMAILDVDEYMYLHDFRGLHEILREDEVEYDVYRFLQLQTWPCNRSSETNLYLERYSCPFSEGVFESHTSKNIYNTATMMYMHVHYPEWTMYKRGEYHLKTLNSTEVGFLRHLRRRGHDAHPERAYMTPKKQKIDELERRMRKLIDGSDKCILTRFTRNRLIQYTSFDFADQLRSRRVCQMKNEWFVESESTKVWAGPILGPCPSDHFHCSQSLEKQISLLHSFLNKTLPALASSKKCLIVDIGFEDFSDMNGIYVSQDEDYICKSCFTRSILYQRRGFWILSFARDFGKQYAKCYQQNVDPWICDDWRVQTKNIHDLRGIHIREWACDGDFERRGTPSF